MYRDGIIQKGLDFLMYNLVDEKTHFNYCYYCELKCMYEINYKYFLN